LLCRLLARSDQALVTGGGEKGICAHSQKTPGSKLEESATVKIGSIHNEDGKGLLDEEELPRVE
jgi:hypothetical protein